MADATVAPETTKEKKPRRIFMWFFLLSQLPFVAWLISGLTSGGDSCEGLTGDRLSTCEAGTAIGTGIGMALVIGLWFGWNAFLLVGYALFKLARKP